MIHIYIANKMGGIYWKNKKNYCLTSSRSKEAYFKRENTKILPIYPQVVVDSRRALIEHYPQVVVDSSRASIEHTVRTTREIR